MISVLFPVIFIFYMLISVIFNYDDVAAHVNRTPVAFALMIFAVIWWLVLFAPFALKLLGKDKVKNSVIGRNGLINTFDGVVDLNKVISVEKVVGIGGSRRLKIVTTYQNFYIDFFFQKYGSMVSFNDLERPLRSLKKNFLDLN